MLTPEQLEERRNGLGGSEIASILGLNPFSGPLDVYLSKVEGLDAVPNADMERGTFLESGVLAWYTKRTGNTVEPGAPEIHKEHPQIRCTPDALTLNDGFQRLVSVKCPRRAGESWGEAPRGKVPEYAALQLQWEHMVLCSSVEVSRTMHLAALLDGELRIYEIEADLELQAWLKSFALDWWARHVVAKVPPPLDGSDTARAWLRRRFPGDSAPIRKASLSEDLLLIGFREAEQQYEAAEREYERQRQLIEEAVGESAGIESPAGRVTWKKTKAGNRVFKTHWSTT